MYQERQVSEHTLRASRSRVWAIIPSKISYGRQQVDLCAALTLGGALPGGDLVLTLPTSGPQLVGVPSRHVSLRIMHAIVPIDAFAMLEFSLEFRGGRAWFRRERYLGEATPSLPVGNELTAVYPFAFDTRQSTGRKHHNIHLQGFLLYVTLVVWTYDGAIEVKSWVKLRRNRDVASSPVRYPRAHRRPLTI